MSDLSAPEARRAAEWFETKGWTTAPAALRIHADTLDPPETAESLRADRDAYAVELAAERGRCTILAAEVDSLRAELTDERKGHDAEYDAWNDAESALREAPAERDVLATKLASEHAMRLALLGERQSLIDEADSLRAERDHWKETFWAAEHALEESEKDAPDRTWNAGDAEPEGVTQVRDCDGDVWTRTARGWASDGGACGCSWRAVGNCCGTVTEVLP
jgi:hypothetical protein